jgi:hypothetical protein
MGAVHDPSLCTPFETDESEDRLSAYSGPERRTGIDRRQTRPSLRRQLFGGGKRERGRRAEDRSRINHFDRYASSILVLFIVILLLSLTDALLTLILLRRGAVEINPVMAFYIDVGPTTFLIAKYLLTALPLILFLFFKDWIAERYRIAHLLLPAIAAVFGSVILWELYLLARLSS